MAKTRFRYEWSHKAKAFLGPSLEGEPSPLQSNIKAINRDIAVNSGIVWKAPCLYMIALSLVIAAGYLAGYGLIVTRHYNAGIACLVLTPLLAFLLVVSPSLRAKRIDRISKYLKIVNYEYSAMAAKAGCEYSYLLIEDNNSVIDRRDLKSGKLERPSFCQRVLRIKLHRLITEFTKLEDARLPLQKMVSVRFGTKTTSFSVRKVTLEPRCQAEEEAARDASLEFNETERRALTLSLTDVRRLNKPLRNQKIPALHLPKQPLDLPRNDSLFRKNQILGNGDLSEDWADYFNDI